MHFHGNFQITHQLTQIQIKLMFIGTWKGKFT